MNKIEFENAILNYLEDALSAAERQEFEAALESDSSLQVLFDDYQMVMGLENSLSQEVEVPHPSFSTKVLNSIDSDACFLKRKIMEAVRNTRALAFAASTACLVLCVSLVYQNQYASKNTQTSNDK